MQKIATDDLPALIDSLEKAERRLFTQWSGMGQTNRDQLYLKLYRFYAEGEELPENFPDFQSGTGRQLRHRLRRQLLRSLHIAQHNHSPATQLRNALTEAELLHQKGLYQQSLKRLNGVRREARKYHDLSTQREAIAQTIDLQFALNRKWPRQELLDLQAEEQALAAAEARFLAARQLLAQVRHFSSQYVRIVSEERQDQWEALHAQILAQNHPGEGHFPTRAHLLTGLGILELIRRNLDTAAHHFEALTQAWADVPHLIPSHPHLWTLGIRNHLNVLLLSARFYEFGQEISHYQVLAAKFPRLEALTSYPLLSVELLHQMNTGDLDAARPLTHRIGELLDSTGERLPPRRAIQLAYNVAMLYFLHSEFTEARRWCRRIEMMPRAAHRIGIQEFARVWMLFLLFEDGEIDLLNYRLASVQRYFRQRGRLNGYEKLLLELAGKLAKNPLPGELSELFTQFHARLRILQKDPQLQRPVGIQEVILWAGSREAGRTLKEVFVENVRKEW